MTSSVFFETDHKHFYEQFLSYPPTELVAKLTCYYCGTYKHIASYRFSLPINCVIDANFVWGQNPESSKSGEPKYCTRHIQQSKQIVLEICVERWG